MLEVVVDSVDNVEREPFQPICRHVGRLQAENDVAIQARMYDGGIFYFGHHGIRRYARRAVGGDGTFIPGFYAFVQSTRERVKRKLGMMGQ
tara:strand:- start:50776 stop:51048 length:273 start_codon:yes stop_codon:yes gene_type:complete